MRGQAPQIYLPVSRFYLIYCLNKSRLVTLVSSLLDPVAFQTAYLAPVPRALLGQLRSSGTCLIMGSHCSLASVPPWMTQFSPTSNSSPDLLLPLIGQLPTVLYIGYSDQTCHVSDWSTRLHLYPSPSMQDQLQQGRGGCYSHLSSISIIVIISPIIIYCVDYHPLTSCHIHCRREAWQHQRGVSID